MNGEPIPLLLLSPATLPESLASRPPRWSAHVELSSFRATGGQLALIPASGGGLEAVLAGVVLPLDAAAAVRGAAARVPDGVYRLEGWPEQLTPDLAALAWEEGRYRFDRFKSTPAPPRLATLLGAPSMCAEALAEACALARDLINTPANAMGPAELEEVAGRVAARFGAELSITRGDELLEGGYPAVHAVGRAAAADRSPRMVELTWGEAEHPLVAFVGKGVTFDSGGLDLKPSAGMRLMKKDMGGAAHALALGQAIMALGWPVRLAILLPIVENSVSGPAMRPGDVLNTRKGLTIEVGNTDAEGRLILADALTRAGELNPILTIDLATLTGAARIALGPEVVPFYTDDDTLAADIQAGAKVWNDPVWRMPLWASYSGGLESEVADLKNDPDAWVQAGSIAAALFLKRFAPAGPWAHFDLFGWNPRSRPGWPVGAEAQAIRGLFGLLERRFGHG